MQRVTITLDDDLKDALDRHVAQRGYGNRSEALRDLVRDGLAEQAIAAGDADSCVGALVYTYDHEARDLSRRLTQTHHHNHDLTLSTLHVHLNHGSCLEVTVLKGETGKVQGFAEKVISERGVQHGRLVVVPATIERHAHAHGDSRHNRDHTHEHVHVQAGAANPEE